MFSITLKLVYVYHYIKRYAQHYVENLNKNILNNFLIAASYYTRTLLFKKLSSPAPASTPESESTPVLHRGYHQIRQRYIKFYEIFVKYGEIFTRPHAKTCHYKMHVQHNVCHWSFTSSPKQAMLFISFSQLVIQLNQNWVFSIIFLREAQFTHLVHSVIKKRATAWLERPQIKPIHKPCIT